jgi:hydrogenase nickel incorporation protein HypA/HybF
VHEMALTRDLVELVDERCRGRRVTRVVLKVGKLAAVLPDAFRFCFELCAAGTSAEGAELEIIEIDGSARCRVCSVRFALDVPYGECACGSIDLEFLSGHELELERLEVV